VRCSAVQRARDATQRCATRGELRLTNPRRAGGRIRAPLNAVVRACARAGEGAARERREDSYSPCAPPLCRTICIRSRRLLPLRPLALKLSAPVSPARQAFRGSRGTGIARRLKVTRVFRDAGPWNFSSGIARREDCARMGAYPSGETQPAGEAGYEIIYGVGRHLHSARDARVSDGDASSFAGRGRRDEGEGKQEIDVFLARSGGNDFTAGRPLRAGSAEVVQWSRWSLRRDRKRSKNRVKRKARRKNGRGRGGGRAPR